jgi:hypothetical protein
MGVNRQLKFEFGWRSLSLPLEIGNRFADHPKVKVETDSGDVPGLLAT